MGLLRSRILSCLMRTPPVSKAPKKSTLVSEANEHTKASHYPERDLEPLLRAARDFFHNMAHGDASRLSCISYAMTNHAPTGEYRTRFFPGEPAHCPHCGETTLLSRRHILCECPRYVAKFPSLADWGSQRHNDKSLLGFLDKNPTAFSFGELPRDVH